MESTTTGTSKPPMAIPVCISPRAVARLRSNQFTTAVVRAMKPARLEPTAMTKKVSRKVAGELIWLKSIRPMAKITIPTRITARGP